MSIELGVDVSKVNLESNEQAAFKDYMRLARNLPEVGKFIDTVNAGLPEGQFVMTSTMHGESSYGHGMSHDENELHTVYEVKSLKDESELWSRRIGRMCTKAIGLPFLGDRIERLGGELVLVNSKIEFGITFGHNVEIIDINQTPIGNILTNGESVPADRALYRLISQLNEGETRKF